MRKGTLRRGKLRLGRDGGSDWEEERSIFQMANRKPGFKGNALCFRGLGGLTQPVIQLVLFSTISMCVIFRLPKPAMA